MGRVTLQMCALGVSALVSCTGWVGDSPLAGEPSAGEGAAFPTPAGQNVGWRIPTRGYLDPTAQSLPAVYAQDAWNEVMQGVSGAPLNPFFSEAGFNCRRAEEDSGVTLRCPARRSEPRVGRVRRLVLHNTLESLPDTVSIFSQNVPFFRADRSYPVSIHYVVGRDGTVVALVPEDRVAYHAGGPEKNADSLGIEIVANVSNDPGRGHLAARRWNSETRAAELFHAEGMTLPQYRSLLRLVARIAHDHDLSVEDLVSHQDVTPSTTCPNSIWKTGAEFAAWKRTELEKHVACAASALVLSDFSACLQ